MSILRLHNCCNFTMVWSIHGGVAEWLKAPDCKSGRIAYTGSNPVPSTTVCVMRCRYVRCGYSIMVMHQPSKLCISVRFRVPAPTYFLIYCTICTMRSAARQRSTTGSLRASAWPIRLSSSPTVLAGPMRRRVVIAVENSVSPQ